MLPAALSCLFLLLSLLHVYWALGGKLGIEQAIPSRNGIPQFSPGPIITLAVAILLLGCGILVLAVSGTVEIPVPHKLLRLACSSLGLVLIVRAIGDGRWLGFTKRKSDSRFARLDTLVYSPLCLALGIATLSLAISTSGDIGPI